MSFYNTIFKPKFRSRCFVVNVTPNGNTADQARQASLQNIARLKQEREQGKLAKKNLEQNLRAKRKEIKVKEKEINRAKMKHFAEHSWAGKQLAGVWEAGGKALNWIPENAGKLGDAISSVGDKGLDIGNVIHTPGYKDIVDSVSLVVGNEFDKEDIRDDRLGEVKSQIETYLDTQGVKNEIISIIGSSQMRFSDAVANYIQNNRPSIRGNRVEERKWIAIKTKVLKIEKSSNPNMPLAIARVAGAGVVNTVAAVPKVAGEVIKGVARPAKTLNNVKDAISNLDRNKAFKDKIDNVIHQVKSIPYYTECPFDIEHIDGQTKTRVKIKFDRQELAKNPPKHFYRLKYNSEVTVIKDLELPALKAKLMEIAGM